MANYADEYQSRHVIPNETGTTFIWPN